MPYPQLDVNPNTNLTYEDSLMLISELVIACETLNIAHYLGYLENERYFDQKTVPAFKEHLTMLFEMAKSRDHVQLKYKRGRCFGCNRDNRPFEFYSFGDFFVFAINFWQEDGKLTAIAECGYASGSGHRIPRMSDHSE